MNHPRLLVQVDDLTGLAGFSTMIIVVVVAQKRLVAAVPASDFGAR